MIQKMVKDSKFVLSKDEVGYIEVLNDFNNSEEIYISTFNISEKNVKLLNKLKNLDPKVNVYIVTNIPKRYERYYDPEYGKSPREKARESIGNYINKLSPLSFNCQLHPFFNFDNHSKIILTDNIVYVGSENFSDESKNNFESGFITKDKDFIEYLKKEVFSKLLNDSESYTKNKLVLLFYHLRYKLLRIIKKFFVEGFYGDISNFDDHETGAYYETDLFRFMITVNDLYDLIDILYDLKETYDQLLKENLEYTDVLKDIIDKIKIRRILELIDVDTNIFKECEFDYQEFCDLYLEKNTVEYYDESLEDYMDQANDEAFETFENLAENAKKDVNELKMLLEELVKEISDFNVKLTKISINNNIDNTI